jgi:HD-GYP domain-containing protein (c-di-GMP phosphodiesterase class II)
LRLGRELGLDKTQMTALEFGSLLHDIGKIGVPDAILRKPAKLTEEEWARMREHPLHGQQILREIEFLAGAARVVAQHHERWDGSGYPFGLQGEEIDLNARIFSVADAFDAMISDRVYRRGRSYEAAAEELESWSGKQFDPQVVAAFHRVPREDWEDLHRLSVMRKKERLSLQPPVPDLLETDMTALVS